MDRWTRFSRGVRKSDRRLVVMSWSAPHINYNKYAKNVCEAILKSLVFSRSRNLVCSVTTEQLRSISSASDVVNALYKRESVTILPEVYIGFNSQMKCSQGYKELSNNHWNCFAAFVSKFNAPNESMQRPESIAAAILMISVGVNENRHVLSLALVAGDVSVEKLKMTYGKRLVLILFNILYIKLSRQV